MYYKKLARRRFDDICIINSAVRFIKSQTGVEKAYISFGSIQYKTERQSELEKLFENFTVTKENVLALFDKLPAVVDQYYKVACDFPGGDAEYRTAMMTNLLKEFFSDFCRKHFNVETGIEMLQFNDNYR